jgi:hypothetical protein
MLLKHQPTLKTVQPLSFRIRESGISGLSRISTSSIKLSALSIATDAMINPTASK